MLEDFMNGPNRNDIAFLAGSIIGIIAFSLHPAGLSNIVDLLVILFGGAALGTTITVLMPLNMVNALHAFRDKLSWSFKGTQ